jgi:hypothetical protein
MITQPKIFISSTVNDMPSERKAAYNAATKVGGFPVMCEFTMTAQNADSVTTCLSMVRESDIYVLILGGKYGWQPYEKESITELEYKTAIKRKLPVFIFNTTHTKDDLQKQFEARVNKTFWKVVKDAFELETEIEKSLKEEIEKKQNEYFNHKELIYSNLVKIQFPQDLFMAKLNFDKKEVAQYIKEQNRYKRKPTLYDYVVAAIHMNNISFPRDWVLQEDYIMTFHNLQDYSCPLSKIIDVGTAERFSCEEIYNTSQDSMSVFKYLLKSCLETKLHKLGIKWIKDEGLFAFIPVKKDDIGQWLPRKAHWLKTNRNATRTVVDVNRDFKNKEKVFNLKCLACRTKFEYLDSEWFLSIKPDWVFLWSNFTVCSMAFENLQWLKKTEKNMHVLNHFNFILKYLQPPISETLFTEYREYPFLKIGQIEKFDFAPIVPDDSWVNLEAQGADKKLIDKEGNIGLFGL